MKEPAKRPPMKRAEKRPVKKVAKKSAVAKKQPHPKKSAGKPPTRYGRGR